MTGSDIAAVREEIDALDCEIVQRIARRQRWVVEAGRLKQDREAVRAPARVEQVVAKVRAVAEAEGASPEVVARTYRAMIDAFIELELSVHEGEKSSSSRP